VNITTSNQPNKDKRFLIFILEGPSIIHFEPLVNKKGGKFFASPDGIQKIKSWPVIQFQLPP